MNVTINASSLEWMTNGNSLWAARLDDLSGNSVTFSAGYTPTISGRLVKVNNATRPTGTLSYETSDNGVAASAVLYGVGNAQDEEDCVGGTVTRRIAGVDMSLLSWTAGDGVYTATVSGIKSGTANVMCSKGYPVTVSGTTVTVVSSSTPTGYLYYELATPTTSSSTPQTLALTSSTNRVVQTSGDISDSPVSLTYDSLTYTIPLISSRKYAYSDNGVKSVFTDQSTIDVTVAEDMLVDVTQMMNGDTSRINAITTWGDIAAKYPEYASYVAYNQGEVVGSRPVWKQTDGEYAYGIIMDTTSSTVPCQRVEYHNGIVTNVESFSSLPAHNWHRCVMDDLSTRHVNYYLDQEDSTKKYNGTYKGVTSDGSASVLTGADGDFMLEIDPTYWRVTENYAGEGKHLYLVSDRYFQGSEVHRFFYTSPNGDTIRTQYVGAVRACVCDADGNPLNTTEGAINQNSGTASTRKARSLAGALPWVNVSLADMRTASVRNGGSVVNFDFHQYVYLMMMIEYATVNTQAISAGYSNGKTNAYWCWRKAGRTNYGNGTGQILAAENTQDLANFISLKVGSTTLYRDPGSDANDYYAWSTFASTPTRYWTADEAPANGSTAYSDSNGTDSGSVTSSYSAVASASRVIQFQYRGLENPFGEIFEFEDGFQKYQAVEGAVIRNNSNTSELYNRDSSQDGDSSYAWTNATKGTIWTASANPSNNSASYKDSSKTTSTGFTVNVTSYRYYNGEYWHTNATDDYTSTAQHGNESPAYWRYAFDWPPAGYIRAIDANTLMCTKTGNGASGSAWFRDYYNNDTGSGSRVSCVGGSACSGANAGVGYRSVAHALAYSSVSLGGRASA